MIIFLKMHDSNNDSDLYQKQATLSNDKLSRIRLVHNAYSPFIVLYL